MQTGRLPVHVTLALTNPETPSTGIPRNMTGIAMKMRGAGYKTHQVGKWDAGMATWDHTPEGRGYDTSFGYFHHANDYWAMTVQACPVPPPPSPHRSLSAYAANPARACPSPRSHAHPALAPPSRQSALGRRRLASLSPAVL